MSLQKVSGIGAVALIHVCVNTHGCRTEVTVLVVLHEQKKEIRGDSVILSSCRKKESAIGKYSWMRPATASS